MTCTYIPLKYENSLISFYFPHSCYNYWFWVPLVAPMIGGVLGSVMYLVFIEWHLPETEVSEAMDEPAIVDLKPWKVSQPEDYKDKSESIEIKQAKL